MARKLFISFLGTGNYGKGRYSRNGYTSSETRFIQVATLEYLEHIGEWDKTSASDHVIILTTKDSESKNWVDDGQIDPNIKQPGLESELNRTGFEQQTSRIDVPDGSNDGDILKIFETVYNLLDEGDEVYFDLTHAFRYLPMLMLVLFNYAKFLKGITVRSITYGNWEGRDKSTNVSKIVDLTQYSTLQDWTNAAASFINSGNADQLSKLILVESGRLAKGDMASKRLSCKLKMTANSLIEVTINMQTCRGKEQIGGKPIKKLKRNIADLNAMELPQLKPVLNKVSKQFNEFNDEADVNNGFRSAKWCLDHGLYQQAITIMREFIISYYYDISYQTFPGDFDKINSMKNRREPIEKVLYILHEKTADDESQWECKSEHIQLIHKIIAEIEFNTDIVETYNKLGDVRNDINHCGMRDEAQHGNDIIDKATKIYSEIYTALYGDV